jgi:hypothetical protein
MGLRVLRKENARVGKNRPPDLPEACFGIILPDYGLATVSASGATCAVSGSDSITCVVSDSVVPCPSEAEFSVLGVHEAKTREKHTAAKIVFIVFFMSYRFKISLNSKNSGRSPTQDVFSFGLPSPDICIKPTLLSGVLL